MYIHCTRIQMILTATNPLWPKIKTVGGLMAFQALIEYLWVLSIEYCESHSISSLGFEDLNPKLRLLMLLACIWLSQLLEWLIAASETNTLGWVTRKILNLEMLVSGRRNSYLPDTYSETTYISTASNGLVHCGDVKGITRVTWPHRSYERRFKMVLDI